MVPLRVSDVIELARRCRRDGRPAIGDPVIRERLVELAIEERAIQLNAVRSGIEALNQQWPFALSLMSKLTVTEFRRRLSAFAIGLQGANAARYMGDAHAVAGGEWQRHYMNAFSATIGGGTSEIQRNIIGERILGLAKG